MRRHRTKARGAPLPQARSKVSILRTDLRSPSPGVIRALTVAAYALLGSLLAWSRLAGLDNGGYCCDEIRTVVDSVRTDPATILTGTYTPNNHELFSLLGWATSSVFGESEVALRLGAAIPFIVGVVFVAAWLHIRLGALAAVLYVAFATVSPLLLDVSRLARGYGLAFLAMSVMVVAALESVSSGRTLVVAAFWAAGVVGTWTLPHMALTFGAIAVVLLTRPDLRARCLVGGGLSILAVAIWYAPHFDDIRASSSQEYGNPIPTVWLLSAPFDQILAPTLMSLDETLVEPSLGTLIAAAAFAVLVGSSPLLHRWESALILSGGIVGTVIAIWITGTHVVPRFLSFLAVPLLILVATGCAFILERMFSRPAFLRTAVVLAVLVVVVATSAPLLASVPLSRRDSLREAAAVIREHAPESAPVYAYMPYSTDLAFHLGRPVNQMTRSSDPAVVCTSDTTVLVAQPWFWPQAIAPSCAARRGARHYRLMQYARGERVDVWIIPEAGARDFGPRLPS